MVVKRPAFSEREKAHPTIALISDGWKLFLSLLRPRYGASRDYPEGKDDRG
jgi:hypothetical protein